MFTLSVFYLIIGVVLGIAFVVVSMYRDEVEKLAGQKLPSQEWILAFSFALVPGWLPIFLVSLYIFYFSDELKK